MLCEFNMHRCFVICGAASRRATRCFACWPVVVLLAMHFAFAPAHGEVIHFRMTGAITIDSHFGPLPDGIYEGAPFVVDLVYDTALQDGRPDDPRRGIYGGKARIPGARPRIGPNHSISFRAGPSEIHASDDLSLWVGNDIDREPPASLGLNLWEHKGDNFQMFDSYIEGNFPLATFRQITFDWRDPSGTAFEGDSLPTTLDLSAFSDTWFRVFTGSLGWEPVFDLRGIVTEIVIVPEPSSLALASIAGLAIIGRWRLTRRLSRISIQRRMVC